MDPVKMPDHSAIGELPEHRYYGWPDAVYREIKRHLNERRDDIAEILSIDIDDWEAWARAYRKRRSARRQSDESAAPAHHAEPCSHVYFISTS